MMTEREIAIGLGLTFSGGVWDPFGFVLFRGAHVKLTTEQAVKYAAYRSRYLFGSLGAFQPTAGHVPQICQQSPGALVQAANTTIGFLRHVGRPASAIGSYLNVDKFSIVPPDQTPDGFEAAPILGFDHADNLIYASYAALNFACEYSILTTREALEICRNILLSFQRLGDHQTGLNEAAGAHAGFMLRSDSVDVDAAPENFCTWLNDPNAARNLEPSYDQYCAALSCLFLITQILDQTTVPASDQALVDDTKAIARERILRSVLFLAGSFWTILFMNSLNEPKVSIRGPYCIHAAYPFAKIAVAATAGSLVNIFGNSFRLAPVPNFPGTADLGQFLTRINADLPTQASIAINAFLVDFLRANFRGNVIAGAIDEVEHMFGGNVDDTIKAALLAVNEVLNTIASVVNVFTQALTNWVGVAQATAAIPFSQFLHRYYSKYMLQTFTDALLVPLGDWLALFGITPPASIDFDFQVSVTFATPNAPGWWPRDLGGNPIGWVAWSKPFSAHIQLSIPLNALWQIPIPLNILDILGLLATGIGGVLQKKPDLQMLVFLNNVAADTFGENFIDPVDSSEYLHNAFAMALTYRFLPGLFMGGNASRNLPRLERLIGLLDSAPETFPKGLAGSSPWNQNFRWMREVSAGAADQLYAGMDYMVPLMLVASNPADVSANRDVLRDALAPKFQQEENMSIFKLQFQGPSTGDFEVYKADAANTEEATLLRLAVGWERSRGSGQVTAKWKDLQGADQHADFLENEPAKMITIPLQTVKANIIGNSKGYFLIEAVR